VHDGARDVERFAESGTQAGCAYAFRADDAVFVEHDRFDAGTRSFACGDAAGGPASDNEKLDLLDH
jgi:hypothetical protein